VRHAFGGSEGHLPGENGMKKHESVRPRADKQAFGRVVRSIVRRGDGGSTDRWCGVRTNGLCTTGRDDASNQPITFCECSGESGCAASRKLCAASRRPL
jgi:hypothetical protein